MKRKSHEEKNHKDRVVVTDERKNFLKGWRKKDGGLRTALKADARTKKNFAR